MGLALYRKYRPATFAEVVGQEHVTEPLRIALAAGRINHAYLFSGPRGCGKTSSARILARSLNCVQGPTPDPCGVCGSCIALAPEGPGSLDVVELDAASHGGVDDTRDLRDRAFYMPAESRFRVFIIDEAHMVTTQGFNALLKIVEEPPEHLVFIFATTEPDKVLTTIRSRTHHYPFRLIAPTTLRTLLERLCAEEQVTVEPAVFPLVIRAGGGSARDSLSMLDQLLAGAGPEGVTYRHAVALLGVTDAALLDEMVDALAAGDGASVFGAVDRVVEAGHDPRRFAADLLQRLRDLLILDAVPDAAAQGAHRQPGGPARLDGGPGGTPGRGHPDPAGRGDAHGSGGDAWHHVAAAGAGADVRPDAAAGGVDRRRRAAAAAGADGTPDGDRRRARGSPGSAAAPPPEVAGPARGAPAAALASPSDRGPRNGGSERVPDHGGCGRGARVERGEGERQQTVAGTHALCRRPRLGPDQIWACPSVRRSARRPPVRRLRRPRPGVPTCVIGAHGWLWLACEWRAVGLRSIHRADPSPRARAVRRRRAGNSRRNPTGGPRRVSRDVRRAVRRGH